MVDIEMSVFSKSVCLIVAVVALFGAGCAKRVRFNPLPLARSGTADARIELTYNRNDTIIVKLSKVPDPSVLNDQYTCYVLWVATPDRRHVINAGQLRVENSKAALSTLTPLRRFILFITAEPSGDMMTPGPDVLFETKEINW